MAETENRGIRIVRRVFPLHRKQNTTVTKLSIVDASVGRFSACGAIWFFNGTPRLSAHDPTVFERLESALIQTLDDYRHFAGQLRWATKEQVKADDNPRYVGRPIVTYGTASDPGVELVISDDRRELKDLVPSLAERSSSLRVWNASGLSQGDFLPPTKLAFSSLGEFEGLPGVAVQLTTFKCGGFAVSMKLTHCLSDAICLVHFIHSWASHSQKLFDSEQAIAEVATPIFDPRRLDSYANLEPKASNPDPERIQKARSLPMHRYDWWATDAPGYPAWATSGSNATKPPPDELSQTDLSPSEYPPWPTWDLSKACEHMQIRFSSAEISGMKAVAVKTLPSDLADQRVSRQDSILAHLWILINRARQLERSDDTIYMDMSLGMRSRLDPPLPDSFIGSPIFLGHVISSGAKATAETSMGVVAGSIRKMMARFTPTAVSDYLYDAAHEVSPQRLWQAFLGSRHVLVTSWARSRAYEVDFFGTGTLPRYVQSQMPLMDGLLQLIDVGETGDFDISLALEKGVMDRLLSDPLLRAYDS
ncbi:transferase [Xylariaceae sp. FL0255]|nr:transferase [Xylariaceae sp. FL0255]